MKKISRKKAKQLAPALFFRRTAAGQKGRQGFILNTSLEPVPFRYSIVRVAKALQILCAELGIDSLRFLPWYPAPWLYQKNDYPPIEAAYQYFLDSGIGKKFDGLIEVPVAELREFIPHLFWLVRGNSTADNYFCDPDGRMILSLCKYGNIHGAYKFSFEKEFEAAAERAGFNVGSECIRTSSALPGRRMLGYKKLN
ncbi:MAG: hypothetical protein Q8919_07175 [Bacteroidota bacterium]|nr:hypothetical protein [Bacteroidota bacterium]